MRSRVLLLCVVLFCSGLIVGGCAKKEMVKKEDLVPAGVQPTASPRQPSVVSKPAGSTSGKEAAKREHPEQVNPLPGTAQLQASLQSIYFDFDSAVLSSSARSGLEKNSVFLKDVSLGKVTIEGHCDERGSDEYNLALGERRAQAAMKYLTTLGVPAGRLAVISYGKEKPANPGHDENAWAKNRRDEFVINR